MKIKYPIGVQSFEKLREEGFFYLDKTDMVWNIAQMTICFLCRPRRFGKSLLISTLDAYFRGKKHLFEGLKIMDKENVWEEYPVFRIDFANINFKKAEELSAYLEDQVASWERQYDVPVQFQNLGKRFETVLQQAHLKTGKRCVVLIDEYDKPLLDVLNEPMEEENRSTLKSFYGTFKAADEHLRFVLLTGVTKFSQVSVFSGFNQPYDLSMDPNFDTVCGVSEEELFTSFAEPIRELAKVYDEDEDGMRQWLKRQYDGYHFSKRMTDVYNPFSLINCFQQQDVQNFWFKSGTPEYLIKLVGGSHLNIQQALQESYRPEDFSAYRADVQQPIPMLYQSGYLTISQANQRTNSYKLDFPNQEVREGFLDLLALSGR